MDCVAGFKVTGIAKYDNLSWSLFQILIGVVANGRILAHH